ncbi:unnamed protein product [Dicrocoelium dendriticum]|nr:unnamed protein product [Dicrocoelium dendriticum]
MSSCDGAHCIIDGGTFVNSEITFQARRNVRAGKAKFCISDSQLWLCLKQMAGVTDICDRMEQECPLKRGGVYTNNNSFFAPDASMEGELTYKLYDEKCNVLACVQYKGGFRSQNKDIQLQFFTGDSYPCGDK